MKRLLDFILKISSTLKTRETQDAARTVAFNFLEDLQEMHILAEQIRAAGSPVITIDAAPCPGPKRKARPAVTHSAVPQIEDEAQR